MVNLRTSEGRPRQAAQATPGPRTILLVLAAVAAGAFCSSGCHSRRLLSEVGLQTAPAYIASNVHNAEPSLPAHLRRVGVLPLTAQSDEASMESGRETLGPVLLGELARSRQFELIPVTPEELRLLTGRSSWTAEERLPLDFFDKLKAKLSVDAVLFCRLTRFQAYEPLAVGWRLKLVDAEEPRILWAVDEVFDARMPEVVAGARRYAREHPDAAGSLQDDRGVLVSPTRFGWYTANAVVGNLPARAAGPP